MPTRLPDHTMTRRPLLPAATVTRRAFLRSLFSTLPLDVALWLRCGRQLRPA